MVVFWATRRRGSVSLLRSIIIIIISSSSSIVRVFFTSALANGLSLEFEWQKVSSSLQDPSQYSGRSQ